MTGWKIRINQDICVGSGTCTSIAPEYFTLNDEDRSSARPGVVPALPELIEAAEFCPTGAIEVVDAETGKSQIDQG